MSFSLNSRITAAPYRSHSGRSDKVSGRSGKVSSQSLSLCDSSLTIAYLNVDPDLLNHTGGDFLLLGNWYLSGTSVMDNGH